MANKNSKLYFTDYFFSVSINNARGFAESQSPLKQFTGLFKLCQEFLTRRINILKKQRSLVIAPGAFSNWKKYRRNLKFLEKI